MPHATPNAEELFSEALGLSEPAARAEFLDRACPDPDLRRRVEKLLAAADDTAGFLANPPPIALASPPAIDDPVPLAAGTSIGPYRLLEAIGEGGMGTVYLAEQSEPVRRRVALKVIKPGMDSKQVVARFEAERQALALMDHPNIARVLDCGTAPSGRPYFVMELVRGLPITAYCDREKMSIRDRLDLFIQVCRAVQHAHQKGIIHRDIKPSNVLVTLIDGAGVPKVIDFGIAKATGGALTDKTLFTGFHQFIGTPLYTSPEQAELSGVDVDTRSDIYSLGVLLYELLTGTTPFDAATLKNAPFDEMRRIIREDDPPRPSTRLSTLGDTLSTVSARRHADPRRLSASMKGEIDWVVMKALDKDRRRRYETANDLASDVLNYLSDRPVEACPPSVRYRVAKLLRRHQGVLLASVLIVGALVVGAGVSLWQAYRAIGAEREARNNLHTAEAQRALAESRLKLARNAVDEMYTRVAEKWLASQPTLTPIQKEFLERARTFYETLSAEVATDAESQHQAVLAAVRVGRICRTLEQYAEAEAVLRRGVEIANRGHQSYPGRPDFVRDLAQARLELALILDKTGRDPEADRELRSVIDNLDSFLARVPNDAEARNLAAMAHRALGDLLKAAAGRAGEALAQFEMAVAGADRLARDYPDVRAYRFDSARSHDSLGSHLAFRGKYEAAEASLRMGLKSTEGLLKDDPRAPELRDLEASGLATLGLVLAQTKRPDEAEAAYLRSIAIRESLQADFPDVERYAINRAGTLNNLSILYLRLGRRKEREESLRKAVMVLEQVADAHPEVPDYRHGWARAMHNVLSDYSRRGEKTEVIRILDRLIPQEKAIARANPANGSYNGLYFNHVKRLAQIRLELGEHAEASRLAEGLAREDLPGDASWRAGLTSHAGWLLIRCAATARADTFMTEPERRKTATAYLERARALLDETARRAQDVPEALAILAMILAIAEDPIVRDLTLSLKHARRAAELAPNSAESLTDLGLAEYRNGHPDAALTALQNGLKRQAGKDDGRARLLLSLIYSGRGDLEHAREEFRLAEARRLETIKIAGRPWDIVTEVGGTLHILYAEAAARLGEPTDAGRVPQ